MELVERRQSKIDEMKPFLLPHGDWQIVVGGGSYVFLCIGTIPDPISNILSCKEIHKMF